MKEIEGMIDLVPLPSESFYVQQDVIPEAETWDTPAATKSICQRILYLVTCCCPRNRYVGLEQDEDELDLR